MKITRVILGVVLFLLLQWSPCIGEEDLSSSSAPVQTNFLKDPITEETERVHNLLFDYKDPNFEKLPFEKLIRQKTASYFMRHGRYTSGGMLSIEEIFERTLRRKELDPSKFKLVRVKGFFSSPTVDSITWWFCFVPKE